MPSPERGQRSILVLDGHTTQALACVRSLGRAGARVFVASTERWPLAAWSRYCRAWVRQGGGGDTPDGLAAVRRWASDRGVEVVLPQRERTCLLCDAERGQWEAAGMTLGCGPTDMLLGAFDKGRTLALAHASGVRIPPTWFPASLADCQAAAAMVSYPCIVKPRFSDFWDAGAGRFQAEHGAHYVRDAVELCESALSLRQGEHWPVIQDIVPGRGKGVSALYEHGQPVAWFAHERLRDVRPSGSSSSLRRSIPVEPRLREPASRLLGALGWHGPAMVEFRDDGSGEPYLIEVNGRLWGSLALAVAAGIDFPLLWTALLRGEPVAPPAGSRNGVTLRWLWGDLKRLLRIVEGPPPGCPEPYPGIWAGLREVLGPQPPGTTVETWSRDDVWPALGEWVQGAGELGGMLQTRLARLVSGVATRQRASTPVAAAR
ncbi:MAG TPA: ATP-grasp domain-containing protein [Gemmatimonadales bacterium]|nr:ATP-grasp domain-containing protein [Gemmatimonadales bacterium]